MAARLSAPVPLSLGEEITSEIVLKACSLKADDLKLDIHPPRVASCGVPLLFVELKSRTALRSAAPRPEIFARELPRDRVVGIHLYVQAKDGEIDVHTRMFAPEHGIPEDPATGSASAVLASQLRACGVLPQGTARFTLAIIASPLATAHCAAPSASCTCLKNPLSAPR